MALLRLDRQRGDGPRIQSLEADRLSSFLAVAVGAFVDPLHRRIDLGDQLALAIAGAKLDGPVGFGGCPVGEVRVIGAFFRKVVEGLARLAQDLVLPCDQLGPELGPLPGVHELFVFRGNIVRKIDILTQRDSPEEYPACAALYRYVYVNSSRNSKFPAFYHCHIFALSDYFFVNIRNS